MFENEEPTVVYQDEGTNTAGRALRYIGMSAAGLYVVGSVVVMFTLGAQLSELRRANNELTAQQKVIAKRLQNSEEELRASTTTLGEKVGLTKKDLADRVAELRRQYKATEEKLQQDYEKRWGEFAGEMAGVKTDVASTRSDLEGAKSRLDQAIGDLGVHSGLIASTREELEQLKRKGERTYFEFTLQKGSRPTPVSTISLQLKKADRKKGRFTLKVLADDREIEKKDRTINEPLQFYTGRERRLYEVVVFAVDKNRVSGYLSTPKS
jgi:hypothetical protein